MSSLLKTLFGQNDEGAANVTTPNIPTAVPPALPAIPAKPLDEKIPSLLAQMNRGLVAREEQASMLLLAALAGENSPALRPSRHRQEPARPPPQGLLRRSQVLRMPLDQIQHARGSLRPDLAQGARAGSL